MPMSPKLLRPRAAITTAFDPRSISGLTGWFDASDASSLAQSSDGTTAVSANGDPVGYMVNKAGGTNAIQTTSTSRRPTYRTGVQNGRSVLRFDGVDDSLVTSITLPTTGNTWFLVSPPVTSGTGYLISAGAANLGPALISGFSARAYEFWTTNSTDRFTLATTASGVSVLTATFVNAGAIVGRRNGTQQGSVTTMARDITSSVFNTIGSAPGAVSPSAVDICEVLTFSRVLSTSEIQAVERWLGGKWGVTVA